MDEKALFKLNPNQNHTISEQNTDFAKINIALVENIHEFTFINQSNIWEDDEEGNRRKRIEISVDKINISWSSLDLSNFGPISLNFSTSEEAIKLNC